MSGAQNVKVTEVFVGASESGKSSRMKLKLVKAKPSRLAIFDPRREYDRYVDQVIDGQVPGALGKFARLVLSSKKFRVAFQPMRGRDAMRDQFNAFCQVCDQAQRLVVVSDELADVTEPNWAPEGWDQVTRAGRHSEIIVMGASQSPSDLDKTFYRNCSSIAVFRLIEAADIDRMAKLLAFERAEITARRAEIAQLKDHESLVLTMKTRTIEKISTTPRELARLP